MATFYPYHPVHLELRPPSRPDTPEHERQLLREIIEKPTHVRRRSAHETPIKLKTPSQSAIPIQFRLGQRASPVSTGSRRQQSPHTSPEAPSPDAFTATPRSRTPRPTSWDSTRQLKPLSLVMKTSRESFRFPDKHDDDEMSQSQSSSPHHASSFGSHIQERSWNPLAGHTSFADFEAFMIAENATNTPLPPVTEDELKAEEADFAPPLPPVTEDELKAEEADFTPRATIEDAINTALPTSTDDELEVMTEFLLPIPEDAINTPLPASSDDDLKVDSELLPLALEDAISTPLPTSSDDDLKVYSELSPLALEDAISTPLPTSSDDDLKADSEFSPLALEDAINTPLPTSSDDGLKVDSEFLSLTLEDAINTPLPTAVDDELDVVPKFLPQISEDAINTPLPPLTDDELDVMPDDLSRVLEDAINKALPSSTDDELAVEVQMLPHVSEDAINTPLPAATDDELNANADVSPESHDISTTTLQDIVSPDPEPVDAMTKDRSSYLLHSSPPFALREGPSKAVEQSSTRALISETPEPADIAEQSSEALVMSDSATDTLPGVAAGAAIVTSLLHDNNYQARTAQGDISEKPFDGVSAKPEAKILETVEQSQQPEARALGDVPEEVSASPSKKSKKKKKGKKNTSLEPEALPSPIVEEVPAVEETPTQVQQEDETPKEDLKGNASSDEIAQSVIDTQADNSQAHNAHKDQPVGDESWTATGSPLAKTESTAIEPHPDHQLAQNANRSLQIDDESQVINETQPDDAEPSPNEVPPIVEARSVIEAQPAAEAPSVVESHQVFETQLPQYDTVPVTPTKKSKKKKNRKSVILDAEPQTPTKPEQAEPSAQKSEVVPVLVPEDAPTISSDFQSPVKALAEGVDPRTDSESIQNPVGTQEPETAMPIEESGASHAREMVPATEPAADLASNSQRGPQVASLSDEDEKSADKIEELPQITEAQDAPLSSESTLRESEPQPAIVPAEIEPSTSSPSKKSKKKKNRKSLVPEPETSTGMTASETQTRVTNEPLAAIEETGPAKHLDQDISTPIFADVLSTPAVDSPPRKLDEQDTSTVELVNAPSSLSMDGGVEDVSQQHSAIQTAPAEHLMTADKETTVLPPTEEKPLGEASIDISVQPVVVEPQISSEQALPDELSVQPPATEEKATTEQVLSDEVQPPNQEPLRFTQSNVPDEPVPTSPKSKKKRRAERRSLLELHRRTWPPPHHKTQQKSQDPPR
ncbi:hypothetical protein PG989_009079 [Apiospora arundinis]